MNEFSEYSNPEEKDYDINSNLNNNVLHFEPYDILRKKQKNEIDINSQQDDAFEIDEDIFEDENIEDTLRKYNYDYKSLLRELTSYINYSDLINILNECGIRKEEYLNPTYVTFEKIRDKIIHNNIKTL